nr:hypothetical protein GCM10025730_22980 [Promicromonospora thailandica]
MRTARFLIAPVTAAAVALSLGACGSGGGGSDDSTIKVAYQKFGNFTQADELFKDVKADFEEANPGITVELVPIEAQQNDYFTKLALMNRSPSTAPDVMYEDTYMIKSDVEAGYLAPLDDYLAEWDEWDQFVDSAKEAGAGDDGKTYGVSMGTDTRGLWFNKDVLAKAGLPEDWAPTSWDDLLEAARTIKESDPDVVPFNMYSGKPQGEAAVMQGFEMLLYGTGDTLYEDGKWVTGSQGFVDALGFVQTVFTEGLAPTRSRRSTPTSATPCRPSGCPRARSASRSTAPGWRATGSSPASLRGPSGPRRWARHPCPRRTGRTRAR